MNIIFSSKTNSMPLESAFMPFTNWIKIGVKKAKRLLNVNDYRYMGELDKRLRKRDPCTVKAVNTSPSAGDPVYHYLLQGIKLFLKL